MIHFTFVIILICFSSIQTNYLAYCQIEITEVKQTNAFIVYIKWNSPPSRYRVFVKSLDDDPNTEIEWPCQSKVHGPSYLYEKKPRKAEWYHRIYDYCFDCMNECIRTTVCTGVTIETIQMEGTQKVNCSFVNSTKINLENIDKYTYFISIRNDANETFVKGLDFGFKYQFRVEIYINQRWKSSRWSTEIDLKPNLTLVQERMGIFKYRINWLLQDKFEYEISRYNVSLNGKIIPLTKGSDEFILNILILNNFMRTFYFVEFEDYRYGTSLEYYQYPLENMVKLNSSIGKNCKNHCTNIQNCIQIVYDEDGYCYAQTRLRQNKAIYNLKKYYYGVYIVQSYVSSYDVTVEPNKVTKFKLSYMFSFGKINETDEIDLSVDAAPLLEITNFINTNFSVKLKWTLTGLNNTYIKGSTIYQKINNIYQSPKEVHSSLEYTFNNLKLNTNYSFKVVMKDNHGNVTHPSNEVTISEPFIVQLKPSSKIFFEGSAESLECLSNLTRAQVKKIVYFKKTETIIHHDKNNYTFNSLKENDSGRYWCLIVLNNEQEMESNTFDLQVRNKPVLEVTHNGFNARSANFSTKCIRCKIEISCTMLGYSKRIPTTYWLYANGTKVRESNLITSKSTKHYTSVLTFHDVKRQYDGSYICVNSENKTENIIFNLYITSPPSKPFIRRAQIFANRTEIEFIIDDDGRMDISGARVELLGKERFYSFRSLNGDSKKGIITIPGEVPEDATIRLRVLNKEGFSAYSDQAKLEQPITILLITIIPPAIFIIISISAIIIFLKKYKNSARNTKTYSNAFEIYQDGYWTYEETKREHENIELAEPKSKLNADYLN